MLADFQFLLIAFSLVLPRTLVCLVILPGIGLNAMTGATRAGVAAAVALPALLPAFLAVRDAPPDMLHGMALVFKEALIGLVMGVLLGIPLWVLQAIGSILDTQRSPIPIAGANPNDQDSSGTGSVMLQAGVMIMIQGGLILALVNTLIESYGTWPAMQLAPAFDVVKAETVLRRFGELLWHVVVYGAPLLIPLLLVDFALGAIGIFAPSLQVSVASSPIKSLLGLFILIAYWATLSHHIGGDFARLLDLIREVFGAPPRSS
ncbi:type III secretion system export apparatus subunit SctT [Aquabacterium sp. A7-Y]|uniref:type III secretion system export apparatus subunit SctT n=1 Tax=Aquabacterium sp. A7-Y TaxID=1349605 RepID=UPI00223DC218|nr:type III secretion system export apparatus subunit SctT [Aquabacterium sp. A7-Y]MCW7536986.1 type III secretion system export apparatus subunit SctT [Aquabacterium sp. A7-Y]